MESLRWYPADLLALQGFIENVRSVIENNNNVLVPVHFRRQVDDAHRLVGVIENVIIETTKLTDVWNAGFCAPWIVPDQSDGFPIRH